MRRDEWSGTPWLKPEAWMVVTTQVLISLSPSRTTLTGLQEHLGSSLVWISSAEPLSATANASLSPVGIGEGKYTAGSKNGEEKHTQK